MNRMSSKARVPVPPSTCRLPWRGFKAVIVVLVSCVSFHFHTAQAHEQAAAHTQQGRHKPAERRAAAKPKPHTPPKKAKSTASHSHAKAAPSSRKIAAQHKAAPRTTSSHVQQSHVQQGKASYYGGAALNGRLTASGERFNQNALTAAHPSLPFGTRIRVTNLSNQRQVVVRVNDRGPFVKGRILDVSTAAAQKINMTGQGVAQVRLEILKGEEVASVRVGQKSPMS